MRIARGKTALAAGFFLASAIGMQLSAIGSEPPAGQPMVEENLPPPVVVPRLPAVPVAPLAEAPPPPGCMAGIEPAKPDGETTAELEGLSPDHPSRAPQATHPS